MRTSLLVLTLCGLLSGAAHGITLYDIDFDGDPLGPVPTGLGPFPRSQISPANPAVYPMGEPTVVDPGPGRSRALALDGVGREGQIEQVGLDIGFGDPKGYVLDVIVFVESLGGGTLAPSRFSILLDDPSSRSLVLDGNGDIRLGPVGDRVGAFAMGDELHFVVTVDRVAQFWSAELNGAVLVEEAFGQGDLERVRFGLQNLAGTDTNRVTLDEIVVRALMPEPGSLMLFAVVALFAGVRRGRQR